MEFASSIDSIPSADLCIIKDVLQHWPDTYITNFLKSIINKRLFNYILVTNCSNQTGNRKDIKISDFDYLSPNMDPLSEFHPDTVLEYFTKTTRLITIN